MAPAFCRIRFTLAPSPDSAIRTEIWLPLTGWNGKLLGVGNFGWGGNLPYGNMAAGIAAGYAVAGNDTGHDESAGPGGRFALGHPDKLTDYGGRANHLMTLRAKDLIRAYYGHEVTHAYFIGCSLGGLQALIEASRFPNDYDGIVAGAPPNPLTAFNAAQLWPGWLVAQDPRRLIPREKLALVNRAVIAACAETPGKEQGFVENPAACNFDPASLLCRHGDTPDCLAAPQVDLLDLTYRGPRDPRSGKAIFPGPARGSEEELWPFVNGTPFANALDLFRYAAFQAPAWTIDRFDWSRTPAKAQAATGAMFTVTPDLAPFFARGGKLMLYVGWRDYHNPAELMGWYETLASNNGEAARRQTRLFAVPGMNHCAGGPGCDTFDKLAVMDRWATGGTAPERILSTRVENGTVTRTRPLCAYPLLARYAGKGDPGDAASFECIAGPRVPPQTR